MLARSGGTIGAESGEELKDVLETLERWVAQGRRIATATVVKTERSAPRDAGAILAVSETGEIAGSVTGGCVEPAVYEEQPSPSMGTKIRREFTARSWQ